MTSPKNKSIKNNPVVSKLVSLNMTRRQLRQLFQSILLYEVIMDGLSEKEGRKPSSMYSLCKKYFSDGETDTMIKKAYDMIENYLNIDDIQDLDLLLDEEKDAVINAFKETEKQGINLHSDDIFLRINQKLRQNGIIRILGNKKKQDD